MLEVTRYEHPLLFVTRRQTGESYRFLVGQNGALASDTSFFECNEARSAALKFLSQHEQKIEAA
jgi:Uncharacterised protein family (UPF0164)